jgi:hypothetical protein
VTAAPICPYCDKTSALVNGTVIYPHRPDLSHKMFYQCVPCKAYVGCHDGTTNPKGRLADAALRAAKIRAHAAFDPLWQGGLMKRNSAYGWLARKLGIPRDACHIGMFDVATCERVVAIFATREKHPEIIGGAS